jgi:sulfite exporter TauE/SafE
MCGPFTMIATHTPSNLNDAVNPASASSWRGKSVFVRAGSYVLNPKSPGVKLLAYHLGRLGTYLILGVIAGFAGTMLNQAGATIGSSGIAAKLVGISMIGFGLVRIASMTKATQSIQHSATLERWTKGILAIGKRIQSTSPIQKAFVLGFVTTWLPCGWLYLFALAASSTGSVVLATWMMFAFWIGTLPLLSVLAIGSESLRSRNVLAKVPFQLIVASLMIAFGVYTIAYRSQIALDGMLSPIHAGELDGSSISALGHEPLPCCKAVSHGNVSPDPMQTNAANAETDKPDAQGGSK